MPAAVDCLALDPTPNTLSGWSATPSSRSAMPYPLRSSTSSPRLTSTAAPGRSAGKVAASMASSAAASGAEGGAGDQGGGAAGEAASAAPALPAPAADSAARRTGPAANPAASPAVRSNEETNADRPHRPRGQGRMALDRSVSMK